MKVALVHDDLVQWGGAERVLVALAEVFPDAPIYTSIFNEQNLLLKEKFGHRQIITSFIQKIPGWRGLYKTLLPFYPLAFEQFDFSKFDLVLSQTTRFAKSIITKPGTKHICYCHTPPRFLWNFSDEKVVFPIQPYLSFLRFYDQVSSRRVDQWVAGSINAQKRIKRIYNADSTVVYPFVDLARFEGIEPFDGGYLLVISRLNKYKKVDLVIKTANRLGLPLKIVGTGPELTNLSAIAGLNVDFLGSVNEDLVVKLLSGCKALVVAAEEDFGLTSLEAQALGKPVVAYGKGGVLESIINGETGYFFKRQTVEDIISALLTLDKKGYNKKKCLERASLFAKDVFMKKFQKLVTL